MILACGRNPGRCFRIAMAGVGFMFGCSPSLYGQPTANNPPGCPPKVKVVWVAPTDSGDVIQGPVCISMAVNSLRYSSNIKLATTVGVGQDLGAVFKAASGIPAAPTVDQVVKEVLTQGGLWIR